jgi:hypothetical protein
MSVGRMAPRSFCFAPRSVQASLVILAGKAGHPDRAQVDVGTAPSLQARSGRGGGVDASDKAYVLVARMRVARDNRTGGSP